MINNNRRPPVKGDLVVFNPGDDAQPVRLVLETRGIRILVTSPEDWPYQWVRRDCVRIINAGR